jgi:hypothetical protein
MGQKHVGMCVVNGKALKPDKMQTGEPKWLHDAGLAVGVVVRTLRSKKPDEPPKKQDEPPKKKAKMSTEKDEPPKKDEDIFGSNPTIPHLQEIPEITGDEQAANRAAGGTVLSSDGPSSQDGAVEEEEEEETVANLMDAGQELLMSRQVSLTTDDGEEDAEAEIRKAFKQFKTATSMDTKLQQKTGELTKLMQQRAASKKGALRPSRRRRLGSWGMRALALVTVLGGLVPVGGRSTVHPKFDWGESVSRPLDMNVSKQVNGTTMTIATYHPSALLSFARFDHYIKWAYASHLVQSGHLLSYSKEPAFITAAYLEHERAFNQFREGCAVTSNDTCNPTSRKPVKTEPADFIGAFRALLASVARNGLRPGPALPFCAATRNLCDGSHRLAAALAFDAPRFLVRMHEPCRCVYRSVRDYSWFAELGYHHMFADWVVSRAILADRSLHVLHIWPVGLHARGYGVLGRVRQLVATTCSIEMGVLYEKAVQLNRNGLTTYIKHAYGDVNWVNPSRYMDGAGPIHVFVVRSSSTLLRTCKSGIRNFFRLPAGRFKASVHGTDTHSEAIVAAQMLFNDNSIAYLNHATDPTACQDIARRVGDDLVRIGLPPSLVNSTHPRPPVYMLPQDMLVESGATASIMSGGGFNDVDLVLSSHATAGRSLVRNCPSRSALPGKRAEARETCLLRYEEHHTDQASVADPTQYAFCWGLKFKMPTQIQDQIQDATEMKSKTKLAKLARLEHARRTCGQGEGNAFCCNGWNASVLRLCTAAQWKCYRGLEKQDQGVIQAVCHTQVCFSHTLG